MDKEQLLTNYFQGELTSNELEEVNALLKEDVEFLEQFNFEKNLQMAIKDKERSKLKEKLQRFEAQKPAPRAISRNRFTPMRIAASIVILLAVVWLIYTISFTSSPEELYAANYDKYPNTVYAITRGNTEDTSLERKAFEAYEANDILKAIGYFQDLKQKSGLDYVDFYLAQAYLANNDFRNAVPLFEKIIEENADFKAEALWYAALANIKTGQETKAKQQLEALILVGSYKKALATELLEKLK
tara:strand:+ start:5203 stop:5934 length:732 start_codon:yes stop_codon:yes gene_type:complete